MQHQPPMYSKEKFGSVQNIYEEKQVEWKIKDFSKFYENEIFVYRNSPFFAFGNYSWFFQLYPKPCDNPTECVALYLQCEERREYSVEYTLGVKRVDNNVEHLVTGILTGNCMYSAVKLINRLEVIKRKCELLPADVLTITCTLKLGNIHLAQPKHESTLEKLIKLETLSENFKSLSANKENFDITLNVQDKEYKAHKAILIARSSVFAAMFRYESSEKKSGIINIPDCDPETFKEFLEFLYCGKLEKLSPSNALRLYETSDKYDIQELKTFCSVYLMKNLSVENLGEIVILADKYDDTELLSAAQCFFNRNLSNVLVTSEWDAFLDNNRRLANKLLLKMSKMKAVHEVLPLEPLSSSFLNG